MNNPETTPTKQPAKYSWSEVWTAALTKPRPETFDELLTDPQAVLRRGLIWIFFSIFLYLVVFTMVLINIAESTGNAAAAALQDVPGPIVLLDVLIWTMVMAAIIVAVYYVFVKFTDYVARRVGGEGTPERIPQLGYTLAASVAPLTIMRIFSIFVPVLALLNVLVLVYQIYLAIVTIQAVYGFDLRDASTTFMIPGVAFFFGQMLIMVLIFA